MTTTMKQVSSMLIWWPTSTGSQKKLANSRRTSASLTKAFDCVDHNKLWKSLQENGLGIPDHLTCLLRNLYAGQEAAIRTEHGTTDFPKLGKDYVKAVYCHPTYFTYMQSTLCKMPDWMKHKLELRLPREIPITSDMQMTPPL